MTGEGEDSYTAFRSVQASMKWRYVGNIFRGRGISAGMKARSEQHVTVHKHQPRPEIIERQSSSQTPFHYSTLYPESPPAVIPHTLSSYLRYIIPIITILIQNNLSHMIPPASPASALEEIQRPMKRLCYATTSKKDQSLCNHQSVSQMFHPAMLSNENKSER